MATLTNSYTTYGAYDGAAKKASFDRVPTVMDFYDGEKYVGTFKFEDGQLIFEGEIEDSAKILFQQFKTYVDNYIKDESLKYKLDSTVEYIK